MINIFFRLGGSTRRRCSRTWRLLSCVLGFTNWNSRHIVHTSRVRLNRLFFWFVHKKGVSWMRTHGVLQSVQCITLACQMSYVSLWHHSHHQRFQTSLMRQNQSIKNFFYKKRINNHKLSLQILISIYFLKNMTANCQYFSNLFENYF